MKILLIHNYYQYWGGEDTYFELLRKLLKDKGHEVIVYTKDSKDIKTFSDKVKTALGMFWNREIYDELTNVIERHKPDVVQLQNIYPLITPTAYWACKRKKIPIIQRISNYRLMCPKGTLFRDNKICEFCVKKRLPYPSIFYRCYHQSRASSLFFSFAMFFHRFILKSYDQIDRIVFPSEFTKDYYLNMGIVSGDKIEVVPSFCAPVKIKKTKITEKDYFVYAGQLVAEKGIEPLLKLFLKNPSLKLVVIGEDHAQFLMRKYRRYKNIMFKGFMKKEEILAYMKYAKATIMPSLWYDVLPNVLIESFSVGTPIIAPRIGVFPEVIQNGETGLLFEYEDWVGLENLLLKFKKSKKIVEHVLRKHEESFNHNKSYSSLINVYQS